MTQHTRRSYRRAFLTSRAMQRSALVVGALALAILFPFAASLLASSSHSSRTLLVRRSWTLPIPEVSAFALRPRDHASPAHLLVLGDKTPLLAELDLQGPAPKNVRTSDLTAALGVTIPACAHSTTPGCRRALEATTGQWEAAAIDNASRLWALQESTRTVHVFSENLKSEESRIHLEFVHDAFFHLKKSSAKRAAGTAPLTSGEGGVEGLALLPNGHLLVAFQSRPASLVEFGPARDRPQGWHPSAMAPVLNSGLPPETTYVSLEYWTLPGMQANCSLNEIATDGLALHVLSSRCKAIFSLEALTPGQRIAKISQTLSLPAGLTKPEALAVVAPGLFIVGDDAAIPATPNVHVLEQEFSKTTREHPQVSKTRRASPFQRFKSIFTRSSRATP